MPNKEKKPNLFLPQWGMVKIFFKILFFQGKKLMQ